MQKSVLTGVVLFVVGVVVGRASVLMTSSSGGPSPLPTEVSRPVPVPTAAPSPGQPADALKGRVAEVIQVPQYTYLRLESGEWAAVDSAPTLQVGAEVGLQLQNEMENFTSPSTGRTFARLWFATLDGAAPVVKQPVPTAQPMVPAPADPVVKGALDAVQGKGALVLRVVDVFTERALLGGRAVRVTAKVDRVNAVQGLHYVHLKDGTGSAGDKSDDLLAISAEPVTAGQSVVMEGTIALDKNVGMGVNPVVLDAARPVK
jgi:hypothetical protein